MANDNTLARSLHDSGAIPTLTGATLTVNAKMGEQQRPRNVATGLLPTSRRWVPVAAVPALAAMALVTRARRKRGQDTSDKAVVVNTAGGAPGAETQTATARPTGGSLGPTVLI
jgi:hypothetical protein